ALKQNYLDPLAQRAYQTLSDPTDSDTGSGGCSDTGLCERAFLISITDALDDDIEVADKKPGYNTGSGAEAFPIDEENENVLRHDRVQYVMDQVDEGIDEYLKNVDEAVEKLLGSWNHLITLLLITFGWLRLRSRRLA